MFKKSISLVLIFNLISLNLAPLASANFKDNLISQYGYILTRLKDANTSLGIEDIETDHYGESLEEFKTHVSQQSEEKLQATAEFVSELETMTRPGVEIILASSEES